MSTQIVNFLILFYITFTGLSNFVFYLGDFFIYKGESSRFVFFFMYQFDMAMLCNLMKLLN